MLYYKGIVVVNHEANLYIAFVAGATFTALVILGLLHLSGGI